MMEMESLSAAVRCWREERTQQAARDLLAAAEEMFASGGDAHDREACHAYLEETAKRPHPDVVWRARCEAADRPGDGAGQLGQSDHAGDIRVHRTLLSGTDRLRQVDRSKGKASRRSRPCSAC